MDNTELLKNNVQQYHGTVNSYRWKYVKEYVGAGRVILDIGCARGEYVKELCDLNYDAYGVDVLDFSEDWKKISCERRCRVIKDSVFPFEDNSFDTVLLFEVLEHINDVDTFFRNVLRITKKRIIMSVPNCNDYYDLRKSNLALHHYTDSSHVNFFTEESLCTLLKKYNLNIVFNKKIMPVNVIYFVLSSFCIPAFIARKMSRILNRFCPKKYYLSIFIVADKQENCS